MLPVSRLLSVVVGREGLAIIRFSSIFNRLLLLVAQLYFSLSKTIENLATMDGTTSNRLLLVMSKQRFEKFAELVMR